MSSRRGNDLRRFSDKSLSTQTRAYCFIQESTPIESSVGDYQNTWVDTTVKPHSVSISPASEKQIMDFDSVNVRGQFLVKIRAEILLSESSRLRIPEEQRKGITVKPERIFEILSVADIQDRGVVKHVMCLERRT